MWQCEPQPKARRVYECGSASRSRRRGESMNEESPMDPHQRARLLSVLEAEGLDALVATTPENLFYLTGFRSISHAIFRGAELYGIVSRRGTGLVVPFIDTAGVAADGIACDRVACYGTFFFAYADPPGEVGEKIRHWTREPAGSAADALAGVLGDLGGAGRRVGLDEGNLFAPAWARLAERLAGTTLIPAYQLLRRARMVKSPTEVARLERAAQIAEDSVAAVLARLGPGVTEREAVMVYEEEVVRRGASPYFSVITIGERAAPDAKQARYYGAALAGERAAIEAMKPGVPVGRIFDIAVQTTRAAGIPHYQRHHVGHGIGLEPYDPPTIAPGGDTVLEPGMVFCVETPYYEHGWGGVQVEDAVEVTAAGARLLTRSSRELRIVG